MTMHSPTLRVLACLLVVGGMAGCGAKQPEQTSAVTVPPSAPSEAPVPSAGIPSPTPTSPAPTSPAPTSPAPTSPAPTSSRTPERTTTAPPDMSTRALPLTLLRTGGFIGANDQVRIAADGTVTATRRDGNVATSTMPRTDLAELQRLVSDPNLADELKSSPGTGVCNDGYVYRLRTPSVSVAANDCSLEQKPTIKKIINLVLRRMNP